MDRRRHATQGIALLLLAALLCAGIVGMALLLWGLGQTSLLAIIAVTAVAFVPIGAFWRAGRYGRAWACLLFLLGGPLAAMSIILLIALISYAS